MLKIHRLENGPIQENAYVLHLEGRAEAVVVDPGDEASRLAEAIKALGLKPVLLVATHGHFDHIGAVDALAKAFGAPFAMHAADKFLLERLEDTAAFYGQQPTREPAVTQALQGGETLSVAGFDLKVIATPGHTPGGLCFYHAPSAGSGQAGSLFSGDTLFQGSVGRSDTEGGSHEVLIQSIHQRLLTLPDATRVYPGHGDATTIGDERRQNPHLQGHGA